MISNSMLSNIAVFLLTMTVQNHHLTLAGSNFEIHLIFNSIRCFMKLELYKIIVVENTSIQENKIETIILCLLLLQQNEGRNYNQNYY